VYSIRPIGCGLIPDRLELSARKRPLEREESSIYGQYIEACGITGWWECDRRRLGGMSERRN